MLQAGQPAPAFTLPDADMELFDLASMHGQHVVLYFYPRDNTPGGIMEAIDFSDHDGEFNRCHCAIVGVSRDDCISHAEFRDKHGLSVRLLADTEGDVCRLYGVWQQKEIDGMKRMGIQRSTFIIDKNGIVRHALYGVNPRGHVAEILQLVRQLDRGEQHAHRQKYRGDAELPRVGSGRKPD